MQRCSGDGASGRRRSLLCLGVVFLCRRFGVHVERETVLSLARGLVQMVAVGVVLAAAAARKSADRHVYSAGHDLRRSGHGGASSPGASRTAVDPLSFYAIAAGVERRDRRACSRPERSRPILVVLVPVGKHDHRQRNECLRAGDGALSERT